MAQGAPASPAGPPWRLLGFVVLSLLLHALLLAGRGPAVPPAALGAPYIRAVLTPQSQAGEPAGEGMGERPGERFGEGTKAHAGEDSTAETQPSAEESPTPKAAGRASSRIAGPAEPRAAKAAAADIDKPARRPLAPPAKPPPRPTRARAATPSVAAMPTEASPVGAMGEASRSKPAAAADTQSARREALRNQLLGALRSRLARHLTYPPRARRRGWEGEVLLGLRIDADGRLRDIRLLHSSGHAVLDRAALRALHRVERLPLPADFAPLQLRLPVIYRLQAG